MQPITWENRPVTDYQIDAQHSSAQFKVRHMTIANVKGEFDKVRGTVYFDPNNLGATKADAAVDISSASTREPDRDTHLKGPDFFDVKEFPEMTFKAQGAETDGDGYQVTAISPFAASPSQGLSKWNP